MAGSPAWKVYTADGIYEAAAKHIETAAAIVAMLGDGATIRYQHSIVVWREGAEEFPASESYDGVGITAEQRVAERLR